MEKDIYLKLEIELSKANQNCWTIKEILSLKSDDLKELNSLLIAEKEKLEPSHEVVEAETQKMMEQYKDMKEIEENNVRLYIVGILTNQKVFEFLEAQK